MDELSTDQATALPVFTSTIVEPAKEEIPETGSTPFSQVGRNVATETANAIISHNQSMELEYSCSIYFEYQDYLSKLHTIQEKNEKQRGDWINSLTSIISSSDLVNREEFPSFQTSRLPMIEALSIASNFLSKNCDPEVYEYCNLIIFSSMLDERRTWNPSSLEEQISFEDVDLILVLLHCLYEDGLCGTLTNEWSTRFENLYGGTPQIILDSLANEDSRKEILIQRITNTFNR